MFIIIPIISYNIYLLYYVYNYTQIIQYEFTINNCIVDSLLN